jgi:AcrR family transcriptional regulator
MARPNRGGDKKRVSAPIWTEPEPGTRRTKVTREQIAQAAFAIADAEGIDAVSMRRIADELGVGTMTLYYYVRTKDDLLALMDDELMAETLVPPDSLPKDWRAAITAVARASRDTFVRHPWSFQMTGYGIGPNGMRHMEQSMRAVETLPLDKRGKMELLAIVDDFVFGHALRMSDALASALEDPRAARSITKFTKAQLATGEFPLIEALMGEDEPIAAFSRIAKWFADEERFDVGLEAILDGFEARIARKKKR